MSTNTYQDVLGATGSLEDEVVNRLTVEYLQGFLSPAEVMILHLYHVEERSLREVGRIVGERFRGRPLSGSTIAYHNKRILRLLRQLAPTLGL